MYRGKRDRQGARRGAEPEGKTDSESTSFDGSFRDKSEAGLLEKLGSTATMEFSSGSAGGESFQERFEGFRDQQEKSTEERSVRARLDSPRSGFTHSIDLDEHLVKPRSVRPSGGKDRHSKVQTSKGLRDRRVRLSVATAIQFYDVQDRLGYDQPSKAVEWLLKKAKAAIDELPTAPAAAGRASSLPGVSAFSPPSAGSSSAQTIMPAAALASTTFPTCFHPHMGLLRSSSTLKDPDHGEEAQAEPNLLEPSSLREGEFGKGDSTAKVESRVKARERARERVKEKGRDGGMNPPSPPHSSQQSFSSSKRSLASSFDSSILGAHESPAYTSFTSLLQSPMHTGVSQVPFQNLVQTLPPSPLQHHLQLSHLQSLYHSSIQNQFIGPQHSFQQALLQASLEPKHFPSPFPQPSYAPGLGTPLSVSEYHPFSAATSSPGSQALNLSQLAAFGILPSTSLVGSFHSESAFGSNSPSSSFRPSTPSTMVDDSYLQGLLRPQFPFPYSNLPSVGTPQFEALQPAASYPHHFVSLVDRNTPGQREFRVFPPVYPNVYQPSSQLPGIIQGLDEEIEELKHRSSSPPPRPP